MYKLVECYKIRVHFFEYIHLIKMKYFMHILLHIILKNVNQIKQIKFHISNS